MVFDERRGGKGMGKQQGDRGTDRLPERWINREMSNKVLQEDKTLWLESKGER